MSHHHHHECGCCVEVECHRCKRGRTGPTGAPGPRGATGATGPQGPTGSFAVDGLPFVAIWKIGDNTTSDPTYVSQNTSRQVNPFTYYAGRFNLDGQPFINGSPALLPTQFPFSDLTSSGWVPGFVPSQIRIYYSLQQAAGYTPGNGNIELGLTWFDQTNPTGAVAGLETKNDFLGPVVIATPASVQSGTLIYTPPTTGPLWTADTRFLLYLSLDPQATGVVPSSNYSAQGVIRFFP